MPLSKSFLESKNKKQKTTNKLDVHFPAGK